jgi:NADH-quinone oxidoreductase subunit N
VGAFSSAFVAFGLALLYGCSGTLGLASLHDAVTKLAETQDAGGLLLARGAFAMLLVGFGFKIAAVPFHAWAPDVYQGAPTAVTSFLGVTSKAAGVAGLLRLVVSVFSPLPEWRSAIVLVAVLTLIVGNCVAMVQEDMKRLLAYSGVSHVGYLLLGVLAIDGRGAGAAGWSGGDPAVAAVLYYVGAYAVMTLGAFAVVAILEEEQGRDVMVIDFAGLARRRPVLSGVMLVLLLSLGGMPPLAGFVGKLLVFLQAVRAGWTWVAVVAAGTSVIGFYYYLRPVLQMYLREPADAAPPQRSRWGVAGVVAALMMIAVVLGGLVGGRLVGGMQATAASAAAAP